jgi:Zn-dependent protease with chaperone function
MKTFFEHQQLARRNSRIMVVLFLLAVAAVVAAVDLVLAAIWLWTDGTPASTGVYVTGAVVTAAVIFIVSLFNVARLGSGGAAVAKMVGARPVAPNTADPLERRLRNVVEEMAIASGVRVPEVYVMDQESGINAFAAGWDVSGAAVAVTRGTLERLTRDELQAVIGHEFSHILNGDMRLNIRMLGVLAGIVFLGSIGEFVMRSVRGTKEKEGLALLAIGVALFLIGYVGLFFARLIKAAVSRQREYLADASSVQFTRNADAIAGALDQIRSSSAGTLIANRYAEEMSHMFFGQSVKMWMGGLLNTHPPLDERIRRVNPRFQPSAYRTTREAMVEKVQEKVSMAPTGRRASDLSAAWGRTPAQSAALVGTMDAGKVDYAARLLATIPPALRDALRDPEQAGPVMAALLLADPEAARERQLQAIPGAVIGQRVRAIAAAVPPLTRGLGLAYHLPVIDLALAAVKRQQAGAKLEILAAIEAVIHADRRVSLHEFVVLALVRTQLSERPKPVEVKRIRELSAEAATVLALVAYAGTRADATGARDAALQAAIRAGASVLGIPESVPSPATLTLDSASKALEALRGLAPMQKGLLVKGLFAAVTVDGTIRVAEAGLMRVVGAVLDCPLPPLLESLDPATLAA